MTVRLALALLLAGTVASGWTWSASSGQPVPTPIGVARAYRLPAASAAVRAARPVGAFTCERSSPRRFRVHLELFARKLVLLVPAGVGIAPPLRRDHGRVVGGRCLYPLRTRDPTGVIDVATRRAVRLGDVFRIWGQALAPRRIAGFRSSRPLLAFVNGKPYAGDPRSIPLRRHDEIVLEIGGYVPPHSSYLFPKDAP